MRDPQEILSRAGHGAPASDWRVFSKPRGRVRGFFSGTAHDPDPLLVVTGDGVVEYVNNKSDLSVVDFDDLADITLRVSGRSFSDSMRVNLDVWIDLRFRNGRKATWRSASFADDYRTVQSFIEAYGAYRARLRRL
jgi:hypothetical protein